MNDRIGLTTKATRRGEELEAADGGNRWLQGIDSPTSSSLEHHPSVPLPLRGPGDGGWSFQMRFGVSPLPSRALQHEQIRVNCQEPTQS